MKTRLASLLVALTLAATTQLPAQSRITVQAVNDDISYSLDLKAVASVFGDSRDLEDFERRLNDYDSGISNLDLNGDGEVDYLRVIEANENNVHLVVIQAVLDRDVYQDVATIVVDRDQYNRPYVQVVGDPYIYGTNYIIDPVFYRTPLIVSWFWSPRYYSWNSPYYWGYYPRYYRYRRPIDINIYLSNVGIHINGRNHYRYSDNWRNDRAYRIYGSVARNDYGTRYPDRTFAHRNSSDVRNRAAFDNSRGYSDGRRDDRRSSYGSRQSDGGRSSYGVRSDRGSRSDNDDIYRSRSDNQNRVRQNMDAVRVDQSRSNADRSSSSSNGRSSWSGSRSGDNDGRPSRDANMSRGSESRPTVTREAPRNVERQSNEQVRSESRQSSPARVSERPSNSGSQSRESSRSSSGGDSRREPRR